jgi:hypothetical protein
MGPRAGLDAAEKKNRLPLPEIEHRFLGHPARSPSLHSLSCPVIRQYTWLFLASRKNVCEMENS